MRHSKFQTGQPQAHSQTTYSPATALTTGAPAILEDSAAESTQPFENWPLNPPASSSSNLYPRLASAQRLALVQKTARSYGNQQAQRLITSLRTRTTSSISIQRDFVPPKPAPAPQIKHPEKFATYEEWLAEFDKFAHISGNTFRSSDTPEGTPTGRGFTVLGNGPASHDPKASEDDKPADPVNPGLADHFVDRPTNKWLKANLPEELVYCAYQLPADCADMAIILRHVWLFYHNRTEKYNNWVVGVGAGKTDKARHQQVHEDIKSVFSGNVANMVNAYSDANGNPLRQLDLLKNLLHPGDILVWQHHKLVGKKLVRSGGHTHTITKIDRDKDGNITHINAFQGNQPIFEDEAKLIRQSRGEKPYAQGKRDPLRDAPGRRIELGDFGSEKLQKTQEGLWCWSDDPPTILVAAGPPSSATRKAGATKRTLGQAADWLPVLKKANRDSLLGTVEAALQAMRATVEGGGVVTEELARQIGESAGGQLFKLDRQKPALDKAAHLARLKQIGEVIDTMAKGAVQPKTKDKVSSLFALIKQSFERAGLRNETTVGKSRRIPIEGLSQGPQPKGKKGVGQAIVIIPSALKISSVTAPPPVEVLLHLHGINARLDKGNASRDVTTDLIEQQLEASGRPMLGVLPQGSASAKFGDDFDANSYLDEVFTNLSGAGVWPGAPKVKQVVLSAHSGGGFAFSEGGMLGSSRAPSAAKGKKLGEVALFDAINGPNEFKALEKWLFEQQLPAILAELGSKDNNTVVKKVAFLKESLKFRAYHSGSEGVKPNISAKGNYASRHAQLRLDLNQWFTEHAAQLGGEGSAVFGAFRQNYQVIATGAGSHDSLVGRGQLKDALSVL